MRRAADAGEAGSVVRQPVPPDGSERRPIRCREAAGVSVSPIEPGIRGPESGPPIGADPLRPEPLAGNVNAGSARASAIRGGRGTAPGRLLAVCRAAPSGGGRPGGQAAGDLHGLGNSGHRPVADRVGQQRTGLRWQVPSANRRVTPSHQLRRSTGPGERSGLRSQAPPKPRSEAAPTRDASGCWTAW